VNLSTFPKCFELVWNLNCYRLCQVCFNEVCAEDKRFAIITNIFFNNLSKAHHLCVVPVFRTRKWEIFFKECLPSIQLFSSTASCGVCVCSFDFNLDDWHQWQWNDEKINFSCCLWIQIFLLKSTQNNCVLSFEFICSFPQSFKDFIFKFTSNLG